MTMTGRTGSGERAVTGLMLGLAFVAVGVLVFVFTMFARNERGMLADAVAASLGMILIYLSIVLSKARLISRHRGR